MNKVKLNIKSFIAFILTFLMLISNTNVIFCAGGVNDGNTTLGHDKALNCDYMQFTSKDPHYKLYGNHKFYKRIFGDGVEVYDPRTPDQFQANPLYYLRHFVRENVTIKVPTTPRYLLYNGDCNIKYGNCDPMNQQEHGGWNSQTTQGFRLTNATGEGKGYIFQDGHEALPKTKYVQTVGLPGVTAVGCEFRFSGYTEDGKVQSNPFFANDGDLVFTPQRPSTEFNIGVFAKGYKDAIMSQAPIHKTKINNATTIDKSNPADVLSGKSKAQRNIERLMQVYGFGSKVPHADYKSGAIAWSYKHYSPSDWRYWNEVFQINADATSGMGSFMGHMRNGTAYQTITTPAPLSDIIPTVYQLYDKDQHRVIYTKTVSPKIIYNEGKVKFDVSNVKETTLPRLKIGGHYKVITRFQYLSETYRVASQKGGVADVTTDIGNFGDVEDKSIANKYLAKDNTGKLSTYVIGQDINIPKNYNKNKFSLQVHVSSIYGYDDNSISSDDDIGAIFPINPDKNLRDVEISVIELDKNGHEVKTIKTATRSESDENNTASIGESGTADLEPNTTYKVKMKLKNMSDKYATSYNTYNSIKLGFAYNDNLNTVTTDSHMRSIPKLNSTFIPTATSKGIPAEGTVYFTKTFTVPAYANRLRVFTMVPDTYTAKGDNNLYADDTLRLDFNVIRRNIVDRAITIRDSSGNEVASVYRTDANKLIVNNSKRLDLNKPYTIETILENSNSEQTKTAYKAVDYNVKDGKGKWITSAIGRTEGAYQSKEVWQKTVATVTLTKSDSYTFHTDVPAIYKQNGDNTTTTDDILNLTIKAGKEELQAQGLSLFETEEDAKNNKNATTTVYPDQTYFIRMPIVKLEGTAKSTPLLDGYTKNKNAETGSFTNLSCLGTVTNPKDKTYAVKSVNTTIPKISAKSHIEDEMITKGLDTSKTNNTAIRTWQSTFNLKVVSVLPVPPVITLNDSQSSIYSNESVAVTVQYVAPKNTIHRRCPSAIDIPVTLYGQGCSQTKRVSLETGEKQTVYFTFGTTYRVGSYQYTARVNGGTKTESSLAGRNFKYEFLGEGVDPYADNKKTTEVVVKKGKPKMCTENGDQTKTSMAWSKTYRFLLTLPTYSNYPSSMPISYTLKTIMWFYNGEFVPYSYWSYDYMDYTEWYPSAITKDLTRLTKTVTQNESMNLVAIKMKDKLATDDLRNSKLKNGVQGTKLKKDVDGTGFWEVYCPIDGVTSPKTGYMRAGSGFEVEAVFEYNTDVLDNDNDPYTPNNIPYPFDHDSNWANANVSQNNNYRQDTYKISNQTYKTYGGSEMRNFVTEHPKKFIRPLYMQNGRTAETSVNADTFDTLSISPSCLYSKPDFPTVIPYRISKGTTAVNGELMLDDSKSLEAIEGTTRSYNGLSNLKLKALYNTWGGANRWVHKFVVYTFKPASHKGVVSKKFFVPDNVEGTFTMKFALPSNLGTSSGLGFKGVDDSVAKTTGQSWYCSGATFNFKSHQTIYDDLKTHLTE